jgi:hypothetical protein
MNDVSCFPLSNSVIKKLIEEGFKTVDDFQNVTISDLIKGKILKINKRM